MSELEAIVRWYLTLTVVAAALLPFVAWLGSRLGPARYGLLRPLSLVALTAIVWWPAAVVNLPFTRWTLVAALVLAAAGALRRSGPRGSGAARSPGCGR